MVSDRMVERNLEFVEIRTKEPQVGFGLRTALRVALAPAVAHARGHCRDLVAHREDGLRTRLHRVPLGYASGEMARFVPDRLAPHLVCPWHMRIADDDEGRAVLSGRIESKLAKGRAPVAILRRECWQSAREPRAGRPRKELPPSKHLAGMCFFRSHLHCVPFNLHHRNGRRIARWAQYGRCIRSPRPLGRVLHHIRERCAL